MNKDFEQALRRLFLSWEHRYSILVIDPRRILYRDEHLLIVNKLAGELVVKASGQGKLPLYDYLHEKEPGLRVVHRLDYATSGVLVFARTAEALRVIRDSKFEGWKKTYRAQIGRAHV